MAGAQRVKRPTLERTKPVRNWSAVVAVAPSRSSVEPGVEGATRVVEEYLRTGDTLPRPFTGSASSPGNAQDLGQAMVRAASDMMTFWVELMARSAGGPLQGASSPQARAPREDAAAPVAGPVRVRVEVDSARPTQVHVELHASPERGALRVERLQARSGSAPPLPAEAVRASFDSGVLMVRLRIAPVCPAGFYQGVVVDEATTAPLGTISVEIRTAPRRRAVRR